MTAAGDEGEGAIYDQGTDRLPKPELTEASPGMAIAPPELLRALSDHAFAVWAATHHVPEAAIRAAQAKSRTMGLHQALVELGQVPLETMLEALRPTAVVACRRCQLHYSLGERLVVATLGVVRCAGCGGRLKVVRGADGSTSGIDNSQDVSQAGLETSSSGEHHGAEPFKLVGLLGRGGMGNVYAALTPDGQQVAVKLLHEELLHDPDLKVRFEREGAILGRIQHPNVVATLGRGFDPTSGRPYLMLEYINGRDLESVLVERPHGRLPPREGVFVLDRCARALAAAHAQGVIHRDVKPSNILITALGEVKLSDFGIALSKDIAVRLTGQHEVMGTPQYVPPEVLLGHPWSPPADLYSLGSFAFRILTGQPLFASAQGVTAILQAHIEETPAAVSDLVPGLPVALSDLIARMLAKDPESRPTAAELGGLLEQTGLLEDTRAIAACWATPDDPDALEQSIDISHGGEGASLHKGLAPGRALGPYRIQRQVGRGMTGVVYEAVHDTTQRPFAIKVLRADAMYDTQALQRFDLESQSQALLSATEGVVGIHAAGTTPEGQPYFVMDFVEGPTLEQALREGLERELALDALEAIGDALAVAHEQQLVHRDVKPENIIIGTDGRAWLTDFGVARVLGSNQRLTQTGDVVGTLAYMAPEQADRNLGDGGPTSDVYSLGAVLYEILCGAAPYQGATAVAVYASLLRGDPIARPSSIAPDVPPQLEQVCLQALARDPADRYPDGGSFALALRAAREASTEGSLRFGSAPLPKLDADQRRKVLTILALGGVLVVALMALAIGVRFSQDRARAEARSALRAEIDGLEKLRSAGGPSKVAAAATALLAKLDPDDPWRAEVTTIVRAARREGIQIALREGDLAGARALLSDAAWGGTPPAEVGWVLALSGSFPEALTALPPSATSTRALVAGWSGDAAALATALEPLEAPIAHAIRWDMVHLIGAAPQRVEFEEGSGARGWWAIAGGSQALGEGLPALAAIHYDEARGAADPRVRLEAHLGEARLRIARGDLRGAIEPIGKAWELASTPLEKGRALELAALLGAGLNDNLRAPLDALLGGSALTKAKREASGLPGVREAANAHAARDWTVASGPPEVTPVTLLDQARILALRRRPARAVAHALALTDRAPGPKRSASFAAAERAACAWGRDGPAGLLLARAAELAVVAQRGNSLPAARRAVALLQRAERLRPLSPALWVARARAALTQRDLTTAEDALARADRLSPKDSVISALRARIRTARAAKGRRGLDHERLGGEVNATGEHRMAAQLEAVLADWEEALRQESPGAERSHGLRLEIARTRIEIARRRHLGGGKGLPTSLPAEVQRRVRADLAPLLPPRASWSAVLRAREGLTTALKKESPEGIKSAELKLAQAATGLSGPRHMQALLQLASTGDDAAARAFMTLAGDLPARGLLAIRRAAFSQVQTQAELFRHAGKISSLPLVQLLAEKSSGRLARGADSYRRMAALAFATPELFGLIYGSIIQQEAQVKRMVNAHLAKLDPQIERGAPLAYLTRALALRSYRMRWSEERDGKPAMPEVDRRRQLEHEQRARLGYHDASRAVQLDPAVGAGHLLRALTMGSLGRGAGAKAHWDPRIRPDVHHALECARAGAPGAASVLVYHLHFYPPREAPWLLDVLLSKGFLRNSHALMMNRYQAQVKKRLADLRGRPLWDEWDPGAAARLAGHVAARFPRLALMLELAAGASGAPPARERVQGLLDRLEGESAWAPLAPAERARLAGEANDAIALARAALDQATPAGAWGEQVLAPRLLRAPLVGPRHVAKQDRLNVLLGNFLPEEVRLWELDYRLRAPESSVHLIAEARMHRVRPGFLTRLLDPFSRDQSALRGIQETAVQERLIGWLLGAKEPELAEVRLALDRATAFTRTESAGELLSRLVVEVVRPAALRARGATRDGLVQVALAALRQAQAVERNPHLLWLLIGHLELDRAGLLPVEDKKRAILARRGRETLEGVMPRRLPARLRVLHRWGRVRALIATQEVERGRNLARGLRTRPDAERRLLRAFLKGDPLDPQLRSVREYRLLAR